MDLYDVIISPNALSQLDSYIGYIQYTLLNSQAAYNVWLDAMETRDRLTSTAGSLKPCSHPPAEAARISLCHLSPAQIYHVLYRLDGKTAYVEAIYHQLQDYENLFAKELTDWQ